MGCSSSSPAACTSPSPAAPAASALPVLRGLPQPSPHGLPPRLKVVLLGDSGVGKSCLALRYAKGTFDVSNRITVGAAFILANGTLPDGSTVKFELWDTAGQERYQSLAPLYYRGARAAAVVYSIDSRQSFEKAQFWVQELQRNTSEQTVLALVGNKSDLAADRAVSEDEAQALADSQGMLYLETSAKSGARVHDLFEALARRMAGGLPVSSNALQPAM